MKTYKITFTAPTIKAESQEVTLSLNEVKQIGKYSVKLTNVLTEPTSEHTGSAIVETTSEFGRVASQNAPIAKIK